MLFEQFNLNSSVSLSDPVSVISFISSFFTIALSISKNFQFSQILQHDNEYKLNFHLYLITSSIFSEFWLCYILKFTTDMIFLCFLICFIVNLFFLTAFTCYFFSGKKLTCFIMFEAVFISFTLVIFTKYVSQEITGAIALIFFVIFNFAQSNNYLFSDMNIDYNLFFVGILNIFAFFTWLCFSISSKNLIFTIFSMIGLIFFNMNLVIWIFMFFNKKNLKEGKNKDEPINEKIEVEFDNFLFPDDENIFIID